jgi:hypothetical protein
MEESYLLRVQSAIVMRVLRKGLENKMHKAQEMQIAELVLACFFISLCDREQVSSRLVITLESDRSVHLLHRCGAMKLVLHTLPPHPIELCDRLRDRNGFIEVRSAAADSLAMARPYQA